MGETERMPQHDAPVWELLVTMPDGGRQVVGPFATHAAASDAALTWRDGAQAHRVETLRRQGGRVDIVGIVGRPKSQERGDDGGVIW